MVVSNKLQIQVRNLEIFLNELLFRIVFFSGWLGGTIEETIASFFKILKALCGKKVVQRGYNTVAN